MDTLYFKEYFHIEREHWYFRARYFVIMTHIKMLLNSKAGSIKILNVGVATGHSSELLSQFGEVKSVEFDEECYNFTKRKLNIDIINSSILDLPFNDNSFDLVCAFDVVEHVEDDKLAVSELQRVCKKGGIVTITVPAFMFLWSRHDEINQHFKRYRKKEISRLFDEKRISILYHSYYNFFLFIPISIFRLLNKLFGLTKSSKNNTGSDFSVNSNNDSIISKILYWIFKNENWFVKNKITMPFGVSIICSIEKK